MLCRVLGLNELFAAMVFCFFWTENTHRPKECDAKCIRSGMATRTWFNCSSKTPSNASEGGRKTKRCTRLRIEEGHAMWQGSTRPLNYAFPGRKEKFNWSIACDATCLTSGKATRASWFNCSSKDAENWEIEEEGHVKGKRSRLSHWFLLFLGQKNETNWPKECDATCLTSG